MQKNIQQILQQYFGYEDFRSGQKEIIEAILEHKDCLAILPTGGGKSICFQVPGIVLSGVTLVISPLISLMKDQVDTLCKKGITACYLSSLLSEAELATTYENIALEKYKFIYIAPERLDSKKFQTVIQKITLSLLVIDEAHCISQWGDTFRPAYTTIIAKAKPFLNECPVVAFTATANKKVQQDIITILELKKPFIYYKSFKRVNLFIDITQCFSTTIKNITLLRILQKHSGETGIIYTATRKAAQQLAAFLKSFSFECEYYHGGLENEQKQKVQQAFVSGEVNLITATNAFGMGIDVSNIRFVIHYQIPGNVENYYQEVGRAGRDGKPSFCYLLYCEADCLIQRQLLSKFPQKVAEFEVMRNIIHTKKCVSSQILWYFGEKSTDCNSCYFCQKKYDQEFVEYDSQLLLHTNSAQRNEIKQMISALLPYQKQMLQFPLTHTLIAFLIILKPKNREDFLHIPGIGTGFLNVWHEVLQTILEKNDIIPFYENNRPRNRIPKNI